MREIIVANTIHDARCFAIDMGWTFCASGARKPDGTIVRFATRAEHLRGVENVDVWVAGHINPGDLRDYLDIFTLCRRLKILNKGSEKDYI